MQVKLLRSVLYAVAISTPVLAQTTAHPEEFVETGASSQTIFAYSTFRARLHDALIGDSALPPDLPVALTAVDPSALQNAEVNSTLTFRVAYGLNVKGGALAYSGTLIEAKVKRLRTGKLRVIRGKLQPRVMEIAVPGLIETHPTPPPETLKLILESTPRSHANKTAKQIAMLPLTVPLHAAHIAILIPEYAMLGIVCSVSSCDL